MILIQSSNRRPRIKSGAPRARKSLCATAPDIGRAQRISRLLPKPQFLSRAARAQRRDTISDFGAAAEKRQKKFWTR
jgi:hypothetical protein